MAATELKTRRLFAAIFCGTLPFVSTSTARADDVADARGQVSHIATALSASDAADAMTPFVKTYPNYSKLRTYFAGLISASQVVSEIDVTDEQDSKTQVDLTVHWRLTLTDLQTYYTQDRAGDVNIKLVRVKGKWKIEDFEPIDLFKPAIAHSR